MDPPWWRRWLLHALVVAAVLGGCAWLLRSLDPALILVALREADWPLVALAAALHATVDLLTRAYRWGVLLAPLPWPREPPRLWELTVLMAVSQAASNVLPARPGEAVRVVQLHRRHGMDVGPLVAAQLVEKIVEGLAMALLSIPMLLWGSPSSISRRPLTLMSILGVLGLIAVVIVGRGAGRAGPVGVAPPPAPGSRRLLRRAARFLTLVARSIRLLHAPRIWLRAMAWSLLTCLVTLAVVALCLYATDLHLSLGDTFAVLLVMSVTISIPSTPGQVGVVEAGGVLALGALHISADRALVFALLYHAAQVLPTTLLGLAGLRRELRRPATRPGPGS